MFTRVLVPLDQKRMNAALEYYAGYITLSQAAHLASQTKGNFHLWMRNNKTKFPSIISFNPNAISCKDIDCNRKFVDQKAATGHYTRFHIQKVDSSCSKCSRLIGDHNRSKINPQDCLVCSPLVQKILGFLDNKKTRCQKDRAVIRQRVIEHYGGKCTCCGELTYEFLTVDHINNDGAQHRREMPGKNLYHWLINSNFPEGFQILCYNCNCAKGAYGQCPHQDK